MKTQKIHLLDPLQSQHIAAGEVIERPANIVKELIENSIDAGATLITVRIEKAGKQLITIADNGCGMSDVDAKHCFARHATSKLRTVEQLTTLTTFGFRGEALASIAAVGIVTLTTKEQTEPLLGTQITYHHGILQETKEVACPAGTTIVIKDLFGSLPVRKTFLKQDETEWHQIQSVVNGIALTNLSIGFTLYKDGEAVLNAPAANSLKDRITQLWNHTLSAQLTPLIATSRGISVEGLISLPPYARYGKELIMFWVNNRLVKNSEITKAIAKGYLQSLPAGKYPAAFLSITLDPAQVDVNIHPRKEEVRFTKPGVVSSCIQEAVTAALNEAVTRRISAGSLPVPSTPPTGILPDPFGEPPAAPSPRPWQNSFTNYTTDPTPPVITHARTDQQPVARHTPISFMPPTHTAPVDSTPEPRITHINPTVTLNRCVIIGQLFSTYILIERDDELIIVDQHAAHERILYHQFTNQFTNKEGTQLLFPETITFETPQAVTSLCTVAEFFVSQGIAFAQTGPMHLTVTSAPPQLQKESLAHVLKDAADFIDTHDTLDREVFRQKLNEHVHSHLACKLAVKAGDRLDTQAMEQLVTQLLATPNRFMCIHGRPTMWPISRAELEKKFRRRG
ncbi:MAG: mismatch repair protein MutL [Candidatus Dependentiae bacterium]|nr:mismatch repair protein MutL [Candidatus Dependentiae bacterium]